MAVIKHIAKTHASHFADSLNRSQRNHLRVLLSHQYAFRDLRHALGIADHKVMSHAEHATGLAKAGRTIELFRHHTPA